MVKNRIIMPLFACFIMNTSSDAMLLTHPAFTKLPKSLQGVYRKYPSESFHYMGKFFHWSVILQSAMLQQQVSKKVDTSLSSLAAHGIISFPTADKALINMYRLYEDKPFIDDEPIDWEKEHNNKIELIQQLNCQETSAWCALYINSGTSLLLQEFVYLTLHPDSLLVSASPWNSNVPEYLVKSAAQRAGCCNVGQFGMKYFKEDEIHHLDCCKE